MSVEGWKMAFVKLTGVPCREPLVSCNVLEEMAAREKGRGLEV